ncbi:MAG: NACHT domain-containing protein [Chloroflexota bacterium]|nr:NACHT domain-containing protein [Chloroflexota bacterium]MDQ5865609.1 NACHT domain-containing protein [Chloroflexota bacterium]
MSEGSYRAALLVVRDCWEAIIKFCGIALHADLVRLADGCDGMQQSGVDAELAVLTWELLNKPPSAGDWVNFYLRCSAVGWQRGLQDRLLVPELCLFAHEQPRRPGQTPRLAQGGRALLEAIEWRNRTIGHGAASHDIDEVRQSVLEQEQRLAETLEQLGFLRDVRLQSSTPTGDVVEWNSCTLPSLKSPVDLPPGSRVLPCPTWILRGELSLTLSPFLMMGVEGRSASLLTFDKASNGYYYLDHYTGKKIRFGSVAGIGELAARYQRYVKQQHLAHIVRGGVLASSARAYSGEVIEALQSIEFGSDIQASFVKQTHIDDAFEAALATFDKGEGRGYFHLVGNAGAGKSWFMASLTTPKMSAHASEALCYHIRAGMRQNPELFIEALHNQVQEPSGHNVRGARIRLEESSRPSVTVARFLDQVRQTSSQRRILLAVDGLDELLEPDSAGDRTILDYIPLPEELPPDVVVVLSSRPDNELRPSSRHFVEAISEFNDLYLRYDLREHVVAQEETLRKYLVKRHNITEERLLAQMLHLCKGSFLRASLLGKLCALTSKREWPDAPGEIGDLYSLYLSHKASEIGMGLFGSLHSHILDLLGVSAVPLSISRIADLTGVQEERVLFALFDVGEFFAVAREQKDNVFSIAHVQLADYLRAGRGEEIIALLRQIVEGLFDDASVEEWLVETSELLRKTGQTGLCINLCDMLLLRMPPGSSHRVQVLRTHTDMVHIRGDYTVAAAHLGELARELVEEQDRPIDDPEVVSALIRQAHHLKFVAPVNVARDILLDLLSKLSEDDSAKREIQFMLAGSIGCLDNPGETELEQLQAVVEECRRCGDVYLLTRCLRRIADLCLCLGMPTEALQVALEARSLSEQQPSRQVIYLYSTLAEIHRAEGDLSAALHLHSVTLVEADKRGLRGWAGHGALGAAETCRMLGESDQAARMLDQALAHYRAADNQAWGIVHAGIARFLLTSVKEHLDEPYRLSVKMGYKRDMMYIDSYRAGREPGPLAHNGHFLLFP